MDVFLLAKQIVHNLFTTPGGFYERSEFATLIKCLLLVYASPFIISLKGLAQTARTLNFGWIEQDWASTLTTSPYPCYFILLYTDCKFIATLF